MECLDAVLAGLVDPTVRLRVTPLPPSPKLLENLNRQHFVRTTRISCTQLESYR